MAKKTTKLKRSMFKTDDDYLHALSKKANEMYLLATKHMNDTTLRLVYLGKYETLCRKCVKYDDLIRKKGEYRSVSYANRLAVRAAERNIGIKKLVKSAGIDKPNLITFTLFADVFKGHDKYPMSRTVLGFEYENDKTKWAVLKNDDDNVSWPINRKGYYPLDVAHATMVLN